MLASQVLLADSFVLRLRGLLFRPRLAEGEGLYLVPCRSIHMFGMRYAIDALFLNRAGVVVGLVNSLGPGQLSPLFPSAHGCLELPAGTIASSGTELGDRVEMREAGRSTEND